MPRPRVIPRYRKKGNTAVVTLPCSLPGSRRQVWLGTWQSPESKREYPRITAEWQAAGERQLQAPADLTINEMMAAFLRHARIHYVRADGSQTGEATNYKNSTKPLVDLYGDTAAARFGPLALQAVRRRMIDIGWGRSSINPKVR